MKTTRHGNYLIQLTRLGAFNCYLVQEDDGFTLIDTGLPGSAKAIMAFVQSQGLPLKRIALTHAHGDHVGSFDAICAQSPDAEVLVSTRTSNFLQGDMTLTADEPQAKLRGSFTACKTTPTQLLKDGDMVGSLRAIAAPGHTPDHIAFLDERDGTLIAGDAFQTQGGIAVAGTMRWLFPFPAFATWHPATALETANQLRALNPTRLAVGHGKVIEDPEAAMDMAISAAGGQGVKPAHG